MVEVRLREIHSRLSTMDIERLMYEAGQLHSAASLLNWLSRQWRLSLCLLRWIAASDAGVDITED
jgi:hypothetical protein